MGVTQDTSSYLISQSNNIQRTVTKSIPTGVNVNQYTDIVVEGDRVDTVKPEDLLAAQQNGQGLGVFIIR